MIKKEVALYFFPSVEMEVSVVGVYDSWKKLYMDEPLHYMVYGEEGQNLEDNNTVWTSVPSREEVRSRYVEVTYS